MILFVGSPASGKSTFFHEYLAPMGYERINQDTLKTRDRCVMEATALLERNIPIAIGTLSQSPTHLLTSTLFSLSYPSDPRLLPVLWTNLPQTTQTPQNKPVKSGSIQQTNSPALFDAFISLPQHSQPDTITWSVLLAARQRRSGNCCLWRRYIVICRSFRNRVWKRALRRL